MTVDVCTPMVCLPCGVPHVAGVLRTFFDILYDQDIISEDAFYKWEKSEEAAEMGGKGVARHSVVQFFTWLREEE